MPTTVWRSSAELQLCVADLTNNNNKAIISLSSFDTIEEEMFEEHLIRFEQQNSPPFTCVNSGLSFYIDAIVAYCICIKKMCLFVIGQDITVRIDARGVEHLVVFVLLVACESNTHAVSGVIE